MPRADDGIGRSRHAAHHLRNQAGAVNRQIGGKAGVGVGECAAKAIQIGDHRQCHGLVVPDNASGRGHGFLQPFQMGCGLHRARFQRRQPILGHGHRDQAQHAPVAPVAQRNPDPGGKVLHLPWPGADHGLAQVVVARQIKF